MLELQRRRNKVKETGIITLCKNGMCRTFVRVLPLIDIDQIKNNCDYIFSKIYQDWRRYKLTPRLHTNLISLDGLNFHYVNCIISQIMTCLEAFTFEITYGNSICNHTGKYWKISEISWFLINQKNDNNEMKQYLLMFVFHVSANCFLHWELLLRIRTNHCLRWRSEDRILCVFLISWHIQYWKLFTHQLFGLNNYTAKLQWVQSLDYLAYPFLNCTQEQCMSVSNYHFKNKEFSINQSTRYVSFHSTSHLVYSRSVKFWTLCNFRPRCIANCQGLSLLLSICMTCPYCAEYERWINQNWLNQEEGLPDGNWPYYLRITNFNKFPTAYGNFTWKWLYSTSLKCNNEKKILQK